MSGLIDEPLDLRLLDLLAPDVEDRSHLSQVLCDALEIDLPAIVLVCFELFLRRRAMASEKNAEMPDGFAIIDVFVTGIAYGHELALGHLDPAWLKENQG